MDYRNLSTWRLTRYTLSAITTLALFILLKTSLPTSQAQQQPQPTPIAFETPVAYSTGRAPLYLTAGDFNNDGKPDLATVNASDRTVSLLLNQGNGAFGAKTDFPTGADPVRLVAGDFNNDNKLDLVTTNFGASTFSLLLGNGAGGFAPKTDTATAAGPFALAAGDFNRDNKLDLVVGYAGQTMPNFVSYFPGNGNGTFGTRVDLTAGRAHEELAVADFNADNNPDIAVANINDNSVSILLGNGTGTFAPKRDTALGFNPAALDVADNNGDGKLDLLVSAFFDNKLRLLPGNGDGSFGARVELTLPPPPSTAAESAAQAQVRSSLGLAVPNGPLAHGKNFKCALPPITTSTAPATGNNGLLPATPSDNPKPPDILANFNASRFAILQWQNRFNFAEPQYITQPTPTDFFGLFDLNGDKACDIISSDIQGNKIWVFQHKLREPCPTIRFSLSALPEARIGLPYPVFGILANGGAPPYSFVITGGNLPPGLSFADAFGTGRISGTPTQAGVYTFTVTAIDENGCAGAQNFTLTVRACPPITISPDTPHNATWTTTYNLALSATGGDPPYTFAVSGGNRMTMLSINARTGALSGHAVEVGQNNFTVTATDSFGCTGTKNYSILVNPLPVFDNNLPSQLPSSTLGQTYMQTFPIKDGTAPYVYGVMPGSGQLRGEAGRLRNRATAERALIDGLPPGITLNAATGVLSGTPTTPGTFNFTITATDRNNAQVSRAFSLVVACSTVTLSPTTLPAGQLGTAYTQTLTATGGGTPSFALSAGTLPPGLTFNTTTGALTGTPTQVGTFTFTIRATAAGGCTGTRDYTLTIACPTVALSPTTLPDGRVGRTYQQTLTATGGGTLSFAVSTGALPPGLSLATATGALSGTPTSAGAFTFTVRATSSTTCSGTQSYTLTIAALPNLASVSAANFSAQSFAPEMIVAAFGANLATATQIANTSPLPTSLAGASVRITDSAGAERLAQLFFVSPQQINYLLPAGLAKGRAVVTVFNATELLATGNVQINDVAPGLFTANASGQGVPAAIAIKLRANGEQLFLPVAQFDAQQNRFIPALLELGAADERLFLVLFGTGLRFRSALDKVTAKIGGVDAPVFFAGAQGQFDGLDQVNLEIPKALAGRGLVDLVLSVDGQSANMVQIQIK